MPRIYIFYPYSELALALVKDYNFASLSINGDDYTISVTAAEKDFAEIGKFIDEKALDFNITNAFVDSYETFDHLLADPNVEREVIRDAFADYFHSEKTSNEALTKELNEKDAEIKKLRQV